MSAVIWWVRRDFRLADNPALAAAVATGRPVIPLFILDDLAEGLGAAPKWRLGQGLEALSAALEAAGSQLILRKGPALETLQAVLHETGAREIFWGRVYDPPANARDAAVKTALRADGLAVHSLPGHLLFEPWTVQTGGGGFYRVYTPFWRAVKDRAVPEPGAAPSRIAAPARWPQSDALPDWHLGAAMNRGAAIVAPFARVGEARARDRLAAFLEGAVATYAATRDLPGIDGTSRLSQNLSLGEIGLRTVWHAGMRAFHEGRAGAETFLREIVWREFSYHLLHHTPHIATGNWKPDFDNFPWQGDSDLSVIWQRGRTGVQFVDAAMREMFVTGTMHNRGRMSVASYLTKHLMTDWRVGQRWFEHCLIDWDPASNAMGWQWAAGSGPYAAPFFRIFNPDTQAEKFDAAGSYRRAWIAEISSDPPRTALDYFRAIPESWRLRPSDAYPAPVVPLDTGRQRALAAYGARGSGTAIEA